MRPGIGFLAVVAVLLPGCSSKVGFPKDQKMDVLFPPYIVPAGHGIPDGHLRPLGWQKRSSGRIRETPEMPSAHSLYVKYIKNSKPVQIHDALQNVKVMSDWESDVYLKQQFGDLNVSVTVKKQVLLQDPQHENHVMKFKKFLIDYKFEEWYLVTPIPKKMMAALPLPPCLSCGTFSGRLYEARLWMSSGGTASRLHSHEDHDLHCVLFGRKDFIIIDEKYKDNFQYQENYKNSGSGRSTMDVDRVNMYKFPEIANTPWHHATLTSGDCILVPAGYIHQVRSYGRSLSYSILFSPSLEFDSSDCKKTLSDKNEVKEEEDTKRKTLANARYMWIDMDGHRVLSFDRMEPEALKSTLLHLLRTKDNFYLEQFEHFYNDAMKRFNSKPSAADVFKLLTSGTGHDYLTRDDITHLSDDKIASLSRVLKYGQFPVTIKKRVEL
uniref:Lysine-specific demethylase 8-like n=1 Tax=Crassostrea virginica TaxID=6565 RepID=A0A8B8BMX3_CRAVI|nr:lysine-specific demethylase 8-like [Crassostrea virginica]